MQHPHTLLFDWDNTLADSWGVIHASLHKTFVAMGHTPWSLEDVKAGRDGIHQSLRMSFPRIFGDAWEEARAHYYRFFLDVHLEEISLLDGAKPMLEQLKQRGYTMGIVSNKTGDYLRDEVKHLGVEGYFDVVVGATDANEDKPHGTPIFHALALANIIHATTDDAHHNPDIWMIGDSHTDIEAALNAKCHPVIFGNAITKDDYTQDARLISGISHIHNHDALVTLLDAKREAT